MRSSWNDAEDEALQGLPLAARVLYLQGLRRYMDFRTRLVGDSRRISWQGLTSVLYVEPHQGLVDSGAVSKQQVRRLARWLERAGLVEMKSDEEAKQLVFFLPLADADNSVQKKPDTNPTQTRHTYPDTASCSQAVDPATELQDGTENPGSNPTQAKTEKPTHIPVSGNQEEIKEKELPSGSSKKKTVRPTIDEIRDYVREIGSPIDPEAFFDHYSANGWLVGKAKAPVKDWKACVRTWTRNEKTPASGQPGPGSVGRNQRGNYDTDHDAIARKRAAAARRDEEMQRWAWGGQSGAGQDDLPGNVIDLSTKMERAV